MMPRKVYERSAEGRAEAPGERVFKLLHDRPSEESTPFAFNADLAGSLAGTGMGFVRKIKSSRGVVVELLVEDATAWKPRRLGGLLVFDHRRDGGQAAPLDQRDLIFVRGMALPGSLEGLSPVGAHRLGISLGLHRQRFELSHYQRGAWPGVILNFPQAMTPEQAERWLDVWDQRHEGAEQAGRTAAIGGGAQATVLPVNLADAQYVEANRMTAEQLGAIYAMPKPFLNIGDSSPVDADWRFWVTFGLGWITTAIDQALNADRDLFPAGSRLYCETVTDALLKPDIRTRYEAYKAARQAGWMTSNEIRKLENLPPHPNGDVLQVIPVGGGEPADKAAALTYLKELLSNADEEKAEILRAVLERANGVGVLA
jgi:HK97 family phage portal protein